MQQQQNGIRHKAPVGFAAVRELMGAVLDNMESEASRAVELRARREEQDRRALEDARARSEGEEWARVQTFMANVPARYRDATLSTWKEHGEDKDKRLQRRVWEAANAYAELWPERGDPARSFPQVVAFRGSYGTGKGHIAWSLAKVARIEHGSSIEVVRAQDMVSDIRSAWAGADASTEAAKLARYRNAALLIVDELSREQMTSDPRKQLNDVIVKREEWMRPTVLITNDGEADFCKLIGGALEDRLRGSSDVWYFGTRSYRQNLRRAKTPNVEED